MNLAMSSVRELLQAAIQCHRAGDLPRAESVYRQVLAAEPANATAHHLLGMAAMAQGDTTRGIEHFTRAVECQPTSAEFRHHRGVALGIAGRSSEAALELCEALRLAPNSAAIHNDLGTALRQAGDIQQGEWHYREALRLAPQMAEAHNNLGNALLEHKKYADAAQCFDAAAQLNPLAFEARFNLGNCYCKLEDWSKAEPELRRAIELNPSSADAHQALGRTLWWLGRLDQAEKSYRRALELQGDNLTSRHGLATVLYKQERYEEAVANYRDALRLKPDDVQSLVGLGASLHSLERFEEAIECLRRVLAIDPDEPSACHCLAASLHGLGDYPESEIYFRRVLARGDQDPDSFFRLAQCQAFQGKFAEAISNFDSAIARQSDDAEFHYYRAATWLTQGDFQRGWPEYEWRLKTRYADPPHPQQRWDGRPLEGQRIVLFCEWGFGDTIHFLRYVPQVQQRGGDVLLEVQQGLIPLLKSSGYSQLLPKGSQAPDDCHWQLPLLSLPGLFQTTLETIPAPIPYLQADAGLVEKWRKRLEPCRGLRVAIHWHGSKAWKTDPRSIPLAAFEPLTQVRDVSLISLQKNDDRRQIDELGARWSIMNFGEELDALAGAFMDTAAIMSLVDLVITCDTGTAHVAGALGVPTWVALPRASEWRWMWDREDTPWYPTMRLFRQPRPFDWQTPFNRMASELAALVSKR